MSESRTDRIKRMEGFYDEACKATEELELAIERYKSAEKKIKKLEAYYSGGQWLKDFEADEAGKLPAGLKRGVLSEDGLYDLLDESKSLSEMIKGKA